MTFYLSTVRALRALPGQTTPAHALELPSSHLRPRTPFQPLGPSVPVPATPQQARPPAPHNPALPGHGPHKAGPTSWPSLSPSPSPWRCHMPRAGAAPSVPLAALLLAGRWDRPWLPGSMALRELPALPTPWQQDTCSLCGH